jgi:hypothetical protein
VTKVSYLLAGVSGEPVLFIHPATFAMDNAHVGAWKPGHELPGYIPLYAAPQPAPARVPLTDEQINQITAEQWGAGLGAPYAAYRAYARAVEAAHGIAAPGAPDALEGTP